MLMHEMLHYASGALAPIVMVNVNRTIGSPWGFWPDQTDSLAQRDTGWIQYYSENGQESLDTVIQAFKVAEQVLLPAMVIHEAFYVSHALEPVIIPAQERVDALPPPVRPAPPLRPRSCGVVGQRGEPGHVLPSPQAAGRGHGPGSRAGHRSRRRVRAPRWAGATASWSATAWTAPRSPSWVSAPWCGTARVAVDALRDAGVPVGLVKIKLFRPFPIEHVRAAVAGVPRLVVIERNFSPGRGRVLHQELKAAALRHGRPAHRYTATWRAWAA